MKRKRVQILCYLKQINIQISKITTYSPGWRDIIGGRALDLHVAKTRFVPQHPMWYAEHHQERSLSTELGINT